MRTYEVQAFCKQNPELSIHATIHAKNMSEGVEKLKQMLLAVDMHSYFDFSAVFMIHQPKRTP